MSPPSRETISNRISKLDRNVSKDHTRGLDHTRGARKVHPATGLARYSPTHSLFLETLESLQL